MLLNVFFEVQDGSNKVRLVDRIVLCSSFFEVNPRTVGLFLDKAFPATRPPKIFSGTVAPIREDDEFTVYWYLGREQLNSRLENCMDSFPTDIEKPTEMAEATHKMLGTRPLVHAVDLGRLGAGWIDEYYETSSR